MFLTMISVEAWGGMVCRSPLKMTVASSAIKFLIDFMIQVAWKSRTDPSCAIRLKFSSINTVMPKKKSQRKAPHERKKYCHCSPFCNKKLTYQGRRLHYKRLTRQQLDAVQDSATATVSDHSSYSVNLSSDALEAPRPPTSSSFVKSTKGSESLSDENMDQIDYDGSGEDEGQEPNQRGYRPDEEDGEITGSGAAGAVDTVDDNEHFEWSGGEDNEANMVSVQPEGGEGLGDDIWSDQDSEFDVWKDYHEDNEAAALQSDEERLHEFEDILGPEEQAELWESRVYSTFSNHTLLIIQN